jgi:protease I
MKKNKVLFLVAHDNFNDIEYTIPKQIIEGAGYSVITASDMPGQATSANGVSTHIDRSIQQLSIEDYDALVLVGGPGALKHLDNDVTYSLIQDAIMHDIPVGAICAAARIVAKAGALAGKNATGWDEDGLLKDIFDTHGALYAEEPVVTDGLCVTARGPDEAEVFAHALLAII